MKPYLYCVSFLWLITQGLIAQEYEMIREERVYKSVDGIHLKADVFQLERVPSADPRPAIAFFHGGGWAYGSPSEFHEACTRYARMGFVTFSFQYRLSVNEDGSVPHPDITPVESVKDARSAMRWIRDQASEYKIDPDRIVACGQSAGGQLALSTVLIDNINEKTDNLAISPVPAALILYSSNVNTMEAWVDRLMGDRRQEIWSISPHHNLKTGMPPAIAFHGEEDCMVPLWVVFQFMDKTRSLGNDFELVRFKGRRHYLGNEDQQLKSYYDEEILKRTDEFLAEHGFMDPTIQLP